VRQEIETAIGQKTIENFFYAQGILEEFLHAVLKIGENSLNSEIPNRFKSSAATLCLALQLE